jgi:hypothetical protein
MKHWRINWPSAILLLSMLLIIAAILILPQVDLLDTAFQRNTAPVVVHSQTVRAPLASAARPAVAMVALTDVGVPAEHMPVITVGDANFLPILFHSIRC